MFFSEYLARSLAELKNLGPFSRENCFGLLSRSFIVYGYYSTEKGPTPVISYFKFGANGFELALLKTCRFSV